MIFLSISFLKWCILINRWYRMLLCKQKSEKTRSWVIFAAAFIHVGCEIRFSSSYLFIYLKRTLWSCQKKKKATLKQVFSWQGWDYSKKSLLCCPMCPWQIIHNTDSSIVTVIWTVTYGQILMVRMQVVHL